MTQIRIKRGTRAQLDAAASAGELVAGEPYLITDGPAAAVGTSSTTYLDLVSSTPAIDGGAAATTQFDYQLDGGGA